MSAASEKSSASKKMDDVARPGKSAPSASSRPIIIGHKQLSKDPMMQSDAKDSPEETKEVSRTAPKVIIPLSIDDAPQEEKVAVTPVQATEEDAPESEEASDEEQKDTPPAADLPKEEVVYKEEEKQQPEANEGSAVVDAVVSQTDSKKQAAKEADDDAKQQEAIAKLVSSKKYFVPIGERSRKKRRSRALVGLLLALLLIAGGYLVADKFTDWPLPYEIFKSNATLDSSVSDKVIVPEQKTTTQPKDMVYENREFGFAFTIPEAIYTEHEGDRMVKLGETNNVVSGQSYMITAGAKFMGGFITKDWEVITNDTDTEKRFGFLEYPACSDATDVVRKMLYEKDDVCVGAQVVAAEESGLGEGGSAYEVIVQKKLENSKTAGLEFISQPIALEADTLQALDAELKENDSYIKAIIDFAKSIKSLN